MALLSCLAAGGNACASCEPYTIGLNKFDLALQYIGRASGGDGTPEYTTVTRAMAQKSMRDATRVPARYFRFAAMGFSPDAPGRPGDLSLWRIHPDEYWRAMDKMFADLNAAKICVIPVFLWNRIQIPATLSQPLRELLDDPRSVSWQLLAKYVGEFVARYRNDPALLFYELTNELNLSADLDDEARCRKAQRAADSCRLDSNFTSAEMNGFTGRLSTLIRRLDAGHRISSGFSIPSEHAYHLSRRPEWSPLGGDWHADSQNELAANLREIHRSVDIISVHLYPSNCARLGLSAWNSVDIVDRLQTIAGRLDKPLFVGEFGQADVRAVADDSFVQRMIPKLLEARIPYSAVWVWEFYQFHTDTPYTTEASSYSWEPGYTDALIGMIAAANRSKGSPAARAAPEAIKEFPRVVLTQPLKCGWLREGTELFAVAAADQEQQRTIYFYLNGRELARVGSPPYRAVVGSVSDVSGSTARLEARLCEPHEECGSFGTIVSMTDAPDARQECSTMSR